jgi:uncharacterized membrane protein YbhN (UPF0104 family)
MVPSRSRIGRLRRITGAILGLGLFAGAIWLLQRELRAYNFQDIYHALVEIPNPRLLLALGLTAANFLALSGVDRLALHFIGRRIEYRKVLLASFCGFAFSQSLGFPLITAATVRYRLYSRWGVSTSDVTNILAFCGLTFFLGLFAILGVILLGQPSVPTEVIRLPAAAERAVGSLLLLIVVGYLVWNAYRRHPLRFMGWEFPVPPIRISLAQVGISALDWILIATILYVLLPAGSISYLVLVQIVVLAQLAGIISNVPGGLGVFEAVIFLLLPTELPENLVLASLLAYRGICTMLPLITATICLAGHELASRPQLRFGAGHRRGRG